MNKIPTPIKNEPVPDPRFREVLPGKNEKISFKNDNGHCGYIRTILP